MKRKIRLTESDLHNIVHEAVARTLNEVSYGYVNDRVNGDGYAGKPKRINPNKTPEQIKAQKERITQNFNRLYGGNGIKYDFEPNQQLPKPNGQAQSNGRYVWRHKKQQVPSGGVTINGQRYVPGKDETSYLHPNAWGNTYSPGNPGRFSEEQWAWYGTTPSDARAQVYDSNGNAVDTSQFSQEQIDALNNVNDTRKVDYSFGHKLVYRGGRPFKYQPQQ